MGSELQRQQLQPEELISPRLIIILPCIHEPKSDGYRDI